MPRTHPVHSKIEKLLADAACKRDSTLLPLYLENGVYNFYLKVKSSEAVSGLDSKTLTTKELETMSAKQLRDEVQRLQASFQRQPESSTSVGPKA